MRTTPLFTIAFILGCGSSSALDGPATSSSEQPLACAPTPAFADDPCGAASRYRVEAVGADVQGSTGTLKLRYRNASTTAPWAYPTVQVTADDDRVAPFADGPDLYALGTCKDSDVIERTFSISSPIASGTTLHFTLTPGIIDEQNTQCSLVTTTLQVVVP